MSGLDVFSAVMSASAASSASSAQQASERARDAAEERLEGGAKFLTLTLYDEKRIVTQYFLGIFPISWKMVIGKETKRTRSIKFSDISRLTAVDDEELGSITKVHFEERCDLPFNYLYDLRPIEEVARQLNGH